MVGRFTIQSSSRLIGRCQTISAPAPCAPSAAGETLCLFVDFVALEPENQIVAQFLLQLLRRRVAKMLERGFRPRAQEFKLVLSQSSQA